MVYRFYCMAFFHSQMQRHMINVYSSHTSKSAQYAFIRAYVLIISFMVLSPVDQILLHSWQCHLLITFANSLDPDQDWQSVRSYLDSTCLTALIHVFVQNLYLNIFHYLITVIWASAWDFQQCGMCDHQNLRSACAYAQSDQSLC